MAPLKSGALLIDKSEGPTSQDIVSKLKWALINSGQTEKGFRIGHGGTLDPFATGLMIVLIGEATKLSDCYLHSKKAYSGIISLGTKTDTGDHTGEVTETLSVPELSEEEWNLHAQFFVKNEYWQTPPQYSAKKHEGRPLHSYARAGVEIKLHPILKRIFSFSVKKLNSSELEFEVQCESGTYVRVLAEDLAKQVQSAAYLKTLRRTASSNHQIHQAKDLNSCLEALKNGSPLESLENYLPLNQLVDHIPSTQIDLELADRLKKGQPQATEIILNQANALAPTDAQYFIVRLNQFPIALLSRESGNSSFRLQRILNLTTSDTIG